MMDQNQSISPDSNPQIPQQPQPLPPPYEHSGTSWLEVPAKPEDCTRILNDTGAQITKLREIPGKELGMVLKALRRILKQITSDVTVDQLREQAVKREAKIGGNLFGPVPEGRARKFYYQDTNNWIWEESWIDQAGQTQTLTTRYEVRSGTILKQQGTQTAQAISLAEAQNLAVAAQWYHRFVSRHYQSVA